MKPDSHSSQGCPAVTECRQLHWWSCEDSAGGNWTQSPLNAACDARRTRASGIRAVVIDGSNCGIGGPNDRPLSMWCRQSDQPLQHADEHLSAAPRRLSPSPCLPPASSAPVPASRGPRTAASALRPWPTSGGACTRPPSRPPGRATASPGSLACRTTAWCARCLGGSARVLARWTRPQRSIHQLCPQNRSYQNASWPRRHGADEYPASERVDRRCIVALPAAVAAEPGADPVHGPLHGVRVRVDAPRHPLLLPAPGEAASHDSHPVSWTASGSNLLPARQGSRKLDPKRSCPALVALLWFPVLATGELAAVLPLVWQPTASKSADVLSQIG